MLQKIKNFLNKKSGKVIFLTCALSMLVAGSAFAASGDISSGLDFTPIITSFTDKISPVDIIKIVAMTITAGMTFVLAWFGIRKVIRALREAIKNGRISG